LRKTDVIPLERIACIWSIGQPVELDEERVDSVNGVFDERRFWSGR